MARAYLSLPLSRLASVVDLYRESFAIDDPLPILEWKYLENSAGKGQCWIAEESGQLAGFIGAIPRRVSIAGEERVVLELTDMATNPTFRRRGVFVGIVEHLLRELRVAASFPLVYGFSGEAMLPGYTDRLGFSLARRMTVMSLPFASADSGASRRIVGGVLALARHFRGRSVQDRSLVAEPEEQFGSHFDNIWRAVKADERIVGVRDSRYLNWRFGSHPKNTYTTLVARRGRAAIGYIVLRIDTSVRQRRVWIVDCLWNEDSAGTALVMAATRWAEERHAMDIAAWKTGMSDYDQLFQRAFFLRNPFPFGPGRYGKPFILRKVAENAVASGPWFLTLGDMDTG